MTKFNVGDLCSYIFFSGEVYMSGEIDKVDENGIFLKFSRDRWSGPLPFESIARFLPDGTGDSHEGSKRGVDFYKSIGATTGSDRGSFLRLDMTASEANAVKEKQAKDAARDLRNALRDARKAEEILEGLGYRVYHTKPKPGRWEYLPVTINKTVTEMVPKERTIEI